MTEKRFRIDRKGHMILQIGHVLAQFEDPLDRNPPGTMIWQDAKITDFPELAGIIFKDKG